MGPKLVLVIVHVLKLDLIILLIKAHNLLSNTRSSSILRLMIEIEHLLSCRASTIIHYAFSQYTNHSAFSRVYVSDYRNPYIIRVSIKLCLIVLEILKFSRVLYLSELFCLVFGEDSYIRW